MKIGQKRNYKDIFNSYLIAHFVSEQIAHERRNNLLCYWGFTGALDTVTLLR